jgi:uncharacterized protein YprB with RNaseH-like and TPR domain
MAKYVLDIETSGLNPMENRVTCISVVDTETNVVATFCLENEKVMLIQFWNYLRETQAEEVITFNGDDFDLPFLYKRSLINSVKVIPKLKNLDLRKEVNSFWYNYKKHTEGKLRDWAAILGFQTETEDGEHMVELYEQRDWEGIKLHNQEDCWITLTLYNRCKECGLL